MGIPDENKPILGQLSIEFEVLLGTCKTDLSALESLGPNSILKLNSTVKDPVTLIVSGTPIARGWLEEGSSQDLNIRVSEILTDQ